MLGQSARPPELFFERRGCYAKQWRDSVYPELRTGTMRCWGSLLVRQNYFSRGGGATQSNGETVCIQNSGLERCDVGAVCSSARIIFREEGVLRKAMARQCVSRTPDWNDAMLGQSARPPELFFERRGCYAKQW